jgi:hypothetical protein
MSAESTVPDSSASRAAGYPRPPVGEPGRLPRDPITIPGEAAPGRVWEIILPAGLPLLNLNDRSGHWGKAYRIRKELLGAALEMVRAAKVPHLDRVTILVVYDPPPDWRHRDADNVAPSAKACIDALRPPWLKYGKKWIKAPRGAYVLPDDDSTHVVRTSQEIGPDYPLGRLRMIIKEVVP